VGLEDPVLCRSRSCLHFRGLLRTLRGRVGALRAIRREQSSFKRLFSGDNLKNFLQVFVMMTGFWLTLNTIAAILPGLFGDPVGLSNTNVTITLVIANVVLAGGYVAAGAISQRTGRRPFLIVIGAIIAVVATFLYYLLLSAAPENLFLIVLLTTVIAVLSSHPGDWRLPTSTSASIPAYEPQASV
jgi:Na+/melibiose symporter-like transporter